MTFLNYYIFINPNFIILAKEYNMIDFFISLRILIPELDYWLYTWWVYFFKPRLFYFPYPNLHRIYSIWYVKDPNMFKKWTDERDRKNKEKHQKKRFKVIQKPNKQISRFNSFVLIFGLCLIFSVICINTSFIDFNFVDENLLNEILNSNDEFTDYLNYTTEDFDFLEKKKKFVILDEFTDLPDGDADEEF